MRGRTEALELSLTKPEALTFYLETGAIESFFQWATDRPSALDLLASGQWRIGVFRSQLSGFSQYRGRIRRLGLLNIRLIGDNLRPIDGVFVEELERAFFRKGSPDSRQRAEFYVLVRRCEGVGWVNIISQDRSFEQIPMVNTHFCDPLSRTGADDLPTEFDFVRDFQVHRELARAVGPLLDSPQYGDTMNAAIIALRDHVRQTSALAADGRPLMEQAFSQNGTHCRLNPLTNGDPQSSHQNEQRGFRDIYAGTMTAIRNPLAHEGTGGRFAQSRYPDKRTLLKYLSFLSILFERADGPLP